MPNQLTALSTARHVLIPLCAKVQGELEYMAKPGCNTSVDQPTSWCV